MFGYIKFQNKTVSTRYIILVIIFIINFKAKNKKIPIRRNWDYSVLTLI